MVGVKTNEHSGVFLGTGTTAFVTLANDLQISSSEISAGLYESGIVFATPQEGRALRSWNGRQGRQTRRGSKHGSL